MNSEESPSSYMKLEDATITSFRWKDQTFKVADAPPEVFDAFMAEVIEEIVDVDRTEWDIYDRWDIVNAALEEGFLTLSELPDQTFSLEVLPDEAEETSSESDDKSAPEAVAG